ncbi:MAG: hypothetical protein QOK10_1031 [Pseudonocardiales bacterium]|nr:hypothetical protein [Pseudonocardiales bacterium]
MTESTVTDPNPQPGSAAIRRPDGRQSGLLPLALVTLLAGGALIGGSYLGTIGLLVATAVVQTVLVVSWVLGTGLPGRVGGFVLGIAASAAADAAVMRWHDHGYEPVLAVLGVAIPLMFIHQLTRGVVRTRVVESLSDIAVLLLAVTAMAGLIVLRYQVNGDKTTLAVLGALTAGLVVNHLTDAVLPAPRFDPAINRGLTGVLTGVLAGGAVGALALRDIIDFTGGRAAFLGAAVAAVACLISVGASFAGVHSTMAAPASKAAGAETAEVESADVEAANFKAADLETADFKAAVAGLDDAAFPPEDPEHEIGPWRGVPPLRPVAAALITVALTSPAGYVLVTALAG